jgi:hypothetical protein
VEIFKLFGTILVDSDKANESIHKTDKNAKGLAETFGKGVAAVGKWAAGITTAAAAGAAAVGTAAVKSADALDKSVKKTAAAVGANAEQAEKYKSVIQDVYGDNFGESFDDISDSISVITQNLGDMDAAPLKEITESAYALQDVFDMGVDETARAAKAMKENFGIAAEDAYNYIAKGAQDGLNYSGELIDSINEYSVQFAKLGFSADDMFKIFAQGAENGAWNLDKIGDAVKEFSIRAIDGSDSTREGFEAVGLNADKMSEKFAQGGETAREAFQEVVQALAAMKDPIEQNTAGTDLFGTMWEDLGVDAVAAMGSITDGAYECAGAMDSIKDVNYSSLEDALGGLKRQLETMIQPLGDSLIPLVKDVVSRLSEAAKTVIPRLVKSVQPLLNNITPMIDPLLNLAEELLPQLVDMATPLIEIISELVQSLLPPLVEFISGDIMPILMEIVGWLSERLMPVVIKIIEKLLPPLLDILESLMPLVELALNLLDPVLDVIEALIDPIADILELLSPIVDVVVGLTESILESPIVSGLLERTLGIITELLNDTLFPALEGVAQFLSGDFLGAAETWGGGFESTVRNVCEHIDEIFGTNLAEWYDGFNDFFMEVGSRLYETWNGDKIELVELNSKYSTMQNDLYAAVKNAVYSGMSIDEAIKEAQKKVLDTSEKVYLYDKMADSWNLQGIAIDYYNGKDLPDPKTPITGSAWYADYYQKKEVPKLASGGLVSGTTLAMVGDNIDAAVNPEVVAPLADLSAMISGAFSRALDSFAERLGAGSLQSRQPVTISVQLSDSTELARALIDDFNEIARQDGASPFKGI